MKPITKQKIKLPLGFGMRAEGLPTQPSGTSGAHSRIREKETYGQILNVKGSFAFVQAFFTEEQLYCPEREFYPNMKAGDKVAYIPKEGNRGPYVETLRLLIPTFERMLEDQRIHGTVSRSPDKHRSGLGLVDLDLAKLPSDVADKFTNKFSSKVLFRASDVITSTLPRNHMIDVGDYVEFSVTRLHDSPLSFAHEVKYIQSKRDREMASQVQRMLDAGAVRECGVVTMIKNNEFGFIQAQDRKDEIYFKVDDVLGLGEDERLKEGVEMEFFVVTEIVKGKVSDRAMHLNKAKPGTVQLEIVLGADTIGTVKSVPSPNDDYPGLARLEQKITTDHLGQKKEIEQIDLWQRCMPEDLQVKIGDKLKFNTHYYRPEKLFFAREVQLVSFFSVGRDSGVICNVRDNFGFITSDTRRADLYFRLNQVLDSQGKLVQQQQLKNGMPATFDVMVEDGKMLRAMRVQLTAPTAKKVVEVDERYLIKKDVIGVVVRTIKNNGYGLVKLSPDDWQGAQQVECINQDILQDLWVLDQQQELSNVELFGLPPSLRKQYDVLVNKYFSNLKCEESTISPPANNKGGENTVISVLKISKKDVQAVSAVLNVPNMQISPERAAKMANLMLKDGPVVQFSREDILAEFVQNDLEVIVDLYFDRYRGKVIAKQIRLTDESIEDMVGEQVGVVDLVIDKGDKWGHIRCLPSDERLLWHGNYGGNIAIGKAVVFEARRKGGLRVATNLRVPEGEAMVAMQKQYDALLQDSSVTLLITDQHPPTAVIVDANENKMLKARYMHIDVLVDAIKQLGQKSSTRSWEKVGTVKAETEAMVSEGVVASQEGNTVEEETTESNEAVGSGSGGVEGRVLYKPKYFHPTLRLPLAIQVGEDMASEMKAGSYCSGKVEMMWTPQVQLSNLLPKVTLDQAHKKQGVLSRHRFKLSGKDSQAMITTSELWNRYNVLSLDISEICLSESGSNNTVEYYYCLSQEILLVNENSRDLIVQGDSIDFWALPEFAHYAFAPTLVPKAQPKEHQMNFSGKRPGFNAELKEQKGKTAVNLITMAEGPPNDAAQGFAAGWREVPKEQIASLPWSKLLAHLT